MKKTYDEWKNVLTPEQYRVCRKGGTEPPFSGEWLDNKKKGSYLCACCHQVLFDSKTKFDSGSGWPSFYDVHAKKAILEKSDRQQCMLRTEVICSNCEAHLGHVFKDGPKPTGLRYCINSVSLNFKEKKEKDNPK